MQSVPIFARLLHACVCVCGNVYLASHRSRTNLLLRQPSLPSQIDEVGSLEQESLTHSASSEMGGAEGEEPTVTAIEGESQDTKPGDIEGAGLEVTVEGLGSSAEEAGAEGVESSQKEVGLSNGTVGHVMLSRLDSVSDEVRKSPGFQFLTRADLYKFAKVSDRASIGPRPPKNFCPSYSSSVILFYLLCRLCRFFSTGAKKREDFL